jgi:uncharacterized SAM-binding protein YcdF (DUF218 family)
MTVAVGPGDGPARSDAPRDDATSTTDVVDEHDRSASDGHPGRLAATGDHGDRPAQPRRRHRWLRGVVVLVLLGVGYYAVSLYQVWSTGRSDGAHRAEAIVVLGAAQYDGTPSPQLAARLDHAADLFERGLAPVVMVTGGKQPGDRFTEAESSRAYLLDLGVPDEAILLENEGRTTYGSLEHATDLLRADSIDQVVLVTDPYHALRSRLIAEEVGLAAAVSPTPGSVVTGSSSLRRHVQEAAGVAVGRIVGFDRLTDLTG